MATLPSWTSLGIGDIDVFRESRFDLAAQLLTKSSRVRFEAASKTRWLGPWSTETQLHPNGKTIGDSSLIHVKTSARRSRGFAWLALVTTLLFVTPFAAQPARAFCNQVEA